jgi:hypothetical protein
MTTDSPPTERPGPAAEPDADSVTGRTDVTAVLPVQRDRLTGRAADATVQMFSELHAIYCEQSVDRMVHGRAYELWDELAEEVAGRIRQLSTRRRFAAWERRAHLRASARIHAPGDLPQECAF